MGGTPASCAARNWSQESLERTEGPRARPGNELRRCKDRGSLRHRKTAREKMELLAVGEADAARVGRTGPLWSIVTNKKHH